MSALKQVWTITVRRYHNNVDSLDSDQMCYVNLSVNYLL